MEKRKGFEQIASPEQAEEQFISRVLLHLERHGEKEGEGALLMGVLSSTPIIFFHDILPLLFFCWLLSSPAFCCWQRPDRLPASLSWTSV